MFPDPRRIIPEEAPNAVTSPHVAIDLPENKQHLAAQLRGDEVLVFVEELADVRTEDRKVVHLQMIVDRVAVHGALLLPFGDEEREGGEEPVDRDLALLQASRKLVFGSRGVVGKLGIGSAEIEEGGIIREHAESVVAAIMSDTTRIT